MDTVPLGARSPVNQGPLSGLVSVRVLSPDLDPTPFPRMTTIIENRGRRRMDRRSVRGHVVSNLQRYHLTGDPSRPYEENQRGVLSRWGGADGRGSTTTHTDRDTQPRV